MPSFYKIIPPPGKNRAPAPGNHGHPVRQREDEKRGGGISTAIACAVLCLSIAVALYAVKRAASQPAIQQMTPTSLASTTTEAPPVPEPVARAPRQTATNPLRWADLTLMLRTGFSDDEIIADTAARQLVAPIGPREEAELRGMGAGNRLLAALQSRPLYAAPAIDAPVAGAVSRAAAVALPGIARPPAVYDPAPPVDYAARDRQVASLQARIDDLDERIRRIRANPGQYWYGRDYGVNRQQGMDRYLNQLDRERNDLRRQKWQLEGR